MVSLALWAGVAWGQGGEVAAGISVGDPTGPTLKLGLDARHAVVISAGWDNDGRDDEVYVHADYLTHDYSLVRVPRGRMAVYYGIGARLLDEEREDDTNFGLRVPVGLNYLIPRTPLEAFGEIVPRLDLVPDTDFSFDVALGVRYRFKGRE